jgi:hypothetical protein
VRVGINAMMMVIVRTGNQSFVARIFMLHSRNKRTELRDELI